MSGPDWAEATPGGARPGRSVARSSSPRSRSPARCCSATRRWWCSPSPFVVFATLGLLHRPTRVPRLSSSLDHASLHEGQGTTARLAVADADDAEHLTRAFGRPPYVVAAPARRAGRRAAGRA